MYSILRSENTSTCLTSYSRTRQVTSFYWTLPTVKTDVAGSCPIGRKKWDLEHSYWISQKQLLPWQGQKSYHRGSTSRECAAVWQCRDYSVYSRYTDIKLSLPSGPLKYPVSDMLPLFYRYRILDRQINSS